MRGPSWWCVVGVGLLAACSATPEIAAEPAVTVASIAPRSAADASGTATVADQSADTTTTGAAAVTTTTASTTTTTASTTTTTTSTTTTSTSTTTTTTLPPPPTTTSCRNVAVVGDSTLLPLVTDAWLPGPEHNLQARLREVGVDNVSVSVSGGRSTVERIADWQDNAVEAATAIRQSGFVGCWIVMVGTNDAANVAAGARVGHAERIDRMLAVMAPDPVLWVDARTQRTTGAYANVHMQEFNTQLDVALYRWPNLRAYYWSDAVLDDWFQDDGIHYTREGSAWRSAMTAQALVQRFPALN